jgi:hypothetical protein
MQQEDHEFERSDAILTTSQRERLVLHATNADSDSDDNYTPKHRERIRNRVLNGTKDLSLLFQHLEQRDITQVFEANEKSLQDAADIVDEIRGQMSPSIEALELRSVQDLNKIQDKKENIENQIDTLSGELEDLEGLLDDLQEKKSRLSEQGIQSSSKKRSEHEAKIPEIQKKIGEKRENLSKLKMEHDVLENKRVSTLRAMEESRQLNKTIENVVSSVNNLDFDELPRQIAA